MNEQNSCPVCGSKEFTPLFAKNQLHLVKCRGCGLAKFTDVRQVYDIKNYDYYKNRLLSTREELYNPITTGRYIYLLNRLKTVRKNNAVLDIGCGEGQFLTTAKGLGWNAQGIEVAPYAVQTCKRFNIEVICRDFLQAEVQDDYFDIVTMFEVLEHLVQPKEYLLKANRVLRKGGRLVLTTPNFSSITSRLLREKWRLVHKEHLFYFTPGALKKLLRDAGFKCVEFITKDVTLPELYNFITGKDKRPGKLYNENQSLRKVIEEKKSLLLVKKAVNSLLNVSRLGESMQCICEKV